MYSILFGSVVVENGGTRMFSCYFSACSQAVTKYYVMVCEYYVMGNN